MISKDRSEIGDEREEKKRVDAARRAMERGDKIANRKRVKNAADTKVEHL